MNFNKKESLWIEVSIGMGDCLAGYYLRIIGNQLMVNLTFAEPV